MTWLMSGLGMVSEPDIRASVKSEFEDSDRRTNIDEFVNSLRESTSEDDVIAFQKLPDEIESSLITSLIGISPSIIYQRARQIPF